MKQSFGFFKFIYSIDIDLTPFSEGGFVSTAYIMNHLMISRQTVMQKEGIIMKG